MGAAGCRRKLLTEKVIIAKQAGDAGLTATPR